MTDRIEELLADLRTSAVREIRPPGAAAARRTVRRRRTTGVVALAGALTAALVGGFGLARQPEAAPILPAASASPTAGLNPAPRLAAEALRLIRDDRPAYEQAGPVRPGGFERRMYLSRLTLTVACAGAGRFTLVVTGDVEGDRFDMAEDRELARIEVPCSAAPAPITRRINAYMVPELRFGLEDTTSAGGKAGYAIRVTGDDDATLAPDDEAASVQAVLGRETGARAGGGAPEEEPFDGKFHRSAQHAEFPADERYTFALACRGTGTYAVQIRRGDDGTILAEHAVACSWPPLRKDVELPDALGRNVEFWTRYRAAPGERAETGWALHPR
ncbi:hypothetical protein [Actinoplanes sp. NPDC023714]|uniref:hypothetical protein n=1 Tax=Actinoplanes sp. NPDC023714 TaxID=3154322 RepID=UPI00340A75D5